VQGEETQGKKRAATFFVYIEKGNEREKFPATFGSERTDSSGHRKAKKKEVAVLIITWGGKKKEKKGEKSTVRFIFERTCSPSTCPQGRKKGRKMVLLGITKKKANGWRLG